MLRRFFKGCLLLAIIFLTLPLVAQDMYEEETDQPPAPTIAELKAQLDSDPNNEDYRLQLFYAYNEKGKKADAAQVMETGLRKSPETFRYHFELCPLYLEINQINKAIFHAKKAIEIEPDNAMAVYNMGLAYGEAGLHENAIKAFKRAIELDPSRADVYFDTGVAYFNLSNYQEAISYYEKTLELDPKDARAYFNLGTVYNILNQEDKAISYLQKALDILGPFTEEGRKTIDFIESIRKRDY